MAPTVKPSTRRAFVTAATAVALTAATKRPNIIFILVDDLRWDSLGYSGHPFAETPHIDRLATSGARFANAFVTTPLCSPARASFLTSQYAHKHGVQDNADHSALSHKLTTFPRLLHEAGYETAFIGKWHMGNDDSPRPGFDRWVSFRGQGVYANPEFNINGTRQPQQGYVTDLLNRQAVDFLAQPHAKPFFLYLSHKAIHGPFTPAPRHASDYSGKAIPRAASAGVEPVNQPALALGFTKTPGPVEPTDELVRNQLRCLRSIDDGVGEILDALDRSGRREDTVVIFTSDNGYFWGEHRLGDKRWAYDEALRIPLAMSQPGTIPQGLRIGQIALNIDLAPTILDIAGVKAPKAMQGESLMPLMVREREPRWRETFLAEYFPEPNFPRVPHWQAVRTTQWKYVVYPQLPAATEMYHLTADPLELRNLHGQPEFEKVQKALQDELEDLLKRSR